MFTRKRTAFRGVTKSRPLQCEQQWSKAAQVVHTHRTWCRRGLLRGFGALNSSPHFCGIFTSVSVGSSPRSYLFTFATGRIDVHTAPKYGAKHIRYVTLHFQDRLGAASLSHRNRAAKTVLCVNGNLFRYDFCAGAKAIQYRVT